MTTLPEISDEQVRRACSDLGLRDWTAAVDLTVSSEEANAILGAVGGEAGDVEIDYFRDGLQVELEHGSRFADANVTNNHPVLTGKIVLAHLKESLLYYRRLLVAELEGDLLKATKERNAENVRSVHERVLDARIA